jgi:hypothetical protein
MGTAGHRTTRVYARMLARRCVVCAPLCALVLPPFASLARVDFGSCGLLVMRVDEVIDGLLRVASEDDDHRGGCVCPVSACMCGRRCARRNCLSSRPGIAAVGEVVSKTSVGDFGWR